MSFEPVFIFVIIILLLLLTLFIVGIVLLTNSNKKKKKDGLIMLIFSLATPLIFWVWNKVYFYFVMQAVTTEVGKVFQWH